MISIIIIIMHDYEHHTGWLRHKLSSCNNTIELLLIIVQ